MWVGTTGSKLNSRYFIFSRKLNFIKTNSILLKRTVVESRNKFFPQFF
ncbi:hypothetical protein LEP1GSC046_3267 [Leptospira kirschneri serovar Bim str. 1051]|nr:hypothetical protein LEP1GSC042_3652 [Leptospira kirschneri serovar Bim str. PUO 1247]EMN03260.1 hypothetical protein LEP1GSC046_3267 [Leptospira kirschneri serovar Bim str. 1051]